MFLEDSVYNSVEVVQIGFVLVVLPVPGDSSGHVTDAY